MLASPAAATGGIGVLTTSAPPRRGYLDWMRAFAVVIMIGSPARERRLNVALGIGGLTLAGASLAASYLPAIHPASDFWTTSTSFFLLRVGIMTALVAAAYAWEVRPGRDAKWRPLEQLGRTSLVIYWIHVEMVYGLVSLPLHGSLALPEAALGFVALTGLMLACPLGKDRVVRWWRMGPHMAVS